MNIPNNLNNTLCCSLFLVGLVICLSVKSAKAGEDDHDHNDVVKMNNEASEAREDDHHHDDVVTMYDALAKQNGVTTATVSSGELALATSLYGRITIDPASLSHIRARFDGVIKDVKVTIGDSVKKGDVLATVESNESLKTYIITAPFTGNVMARHANVGELSNGQILFSLANYENVWAELSVFSNQLAMIKKEQDLLLSHGEFEQHSSIAFIAPSTEGNPYSVAHVPVDNNSGLWPIGTLVKARVTTAIENASVLIPQTAIQEYEGSPVVFVKNDQEYTPHPVVLGRSDGNNIAIIEGLEIGEQIVVSNSYLLKADLEKSEAGHDH